jgi:hypothetical protein
MIVLLYLHTINHRFSPLESIIIMSDSNVELTVLERSHNQHENASFPTIDSQPGLQPSQSQTQTPRPDTSRSANLILLCCSIIQLPIWGMTLFSNPLQTDSL